MVEVGDTELVLPERLSVPESRADAQPRSRAAVPAGPEMYPPGLVIAAPKNDDMFVQNPVRGANSLADLVELIESCRKCSLGSSRTHIVPGEGHPQADLVCCGEAPGQTEDETGRPFVGASGKLLTDILKAIGIDRERDAFILNTLKCRPPGNRTPEPLELNACSPFLHRQLELIGPKVILALGRPAAQTLLNTTAPLKDLRGKVHRYRGIPLVVTFHPAALLRDPKNKSATWDDVRIVRRLLDGEPG